MFQVCLDGVSASRGLEVPEGLRWVDNSANDPRKRGAMDTGCYLVSHEVSAAEVCNATVFSTPQ